MALNPDWFLLKTLQFLLQLAQMLNCIRKKERENAKAIKNTKGFYSFFLSPRFLLLVFVADLLSAGHQNQLFRKIIVNGNMEDSNKVVKTQVSINFPLLSKSNRCTKWHSIFTSHFLATVPGAQISSRLIFLGNWQSHRFFWYKQSHKLLIKLPAILQLPTNRSNLLN